MGGETAYRDKTTETLRVRENVYSQTVISSALEVETS